MVMLKRGFTLLCFCCAACVQAANLPPKVTQALARAGIPLNAVAVWVGPAEGGPAVLAHQPDQAMNPASVMKLVTTWTALETLGPAYLWRTEVWARGSLADGQLVGDLYLKGGGDPRLSMENFWLLLRQLRARGVQQIQGDLVLDRSLYAENSDNPEGFDDEPTNPYNVGPDPLLVNFKAVRFSLLPEAERLRVVPEPWPEGVALENRISLDQGACGEWSDALGANWKKSADGGKTLVLSGRYAQACGEKIWNRALLSAPEFAYGLFRAYWRELGGSLSGQWRLAPVPADARLLLSFNSPPLAEVIRDINKFSNNVMARQLFLHLAVADKASGLTRRDGEAAVRRFLAAQGLDFPELVLDNGSGLSRQERISAAHLGQFLQAAWRSPLAPEFIASLPIAAVDGTFKRRLGGTPAAGRSHLKSGTLNGVKTLAGYVQDVQGKRWIVVFLVNHPKAAAAGPAMDALVTAAAEGQPAP